MSMLSPTRLKAIPLVLIGCGIGLLMIGLALLLIRQDQFGDLDKWAIENAVIVEGVLEIPRHTGRSTPIALRTKDGSIFSCYIAHCGYEGVRNDLGKHARVWLLNGVFVQVEVDNQIKITLPQRIAALQSNPVPKLAILIAPFLIVLGYYIRRKNVSTSNAI